MTVKIKSDYIKRLLKDGKRIDGRGLLDARELKVEKNTAYNAEGSATVTFGDTKVMVGVKMGVGTPFPDSPDEGVLMVNSELSPLASPDFNPGPPSEDSIELARVVDRGIRESKVINTKDLCIEEGEKVWSVAVDIHVLNSDGNLLDASALGAITALNCAKMPTLDENNRPDYSKKEKSLPLKGIPLTTTVGKIDGQLIIDPTGDEEHALEARLTVSVIDDKLCAMQKGGSGGFTPEEVQKVLDVAFKNASKLKPLVEG